MLGLRVLAVLVRVRGRVREVLEAVVGIFGILGAVGVSLVRRQGLWGFGGRLEGYLGFSSHFFSLFLFYVGERGV